MSSSSSSTSSDCRFGIELTKEVNEYNVVGRPQGWRLVVTVTATHNVDPNIFVYLNRGPDPVTEVDRCTFENVASPADIEDWPIGEARDDDDPKFFRLASIDLICRSRELLEETWKGIVTDRDELIRTLEYFCLLKTAEVNKAGRFDTDEQPTILS